MPVAPRTFPEPFVLVFILLGKDAALLCTSVVISKRNPSKRHRMHVRLVAFICPKIALKFQKSRRFRRFFKEPSLIGDF